MVNITTCEHQWIVNSGSNDKPCTQCYRYPDLKFRYRCKICLSEICVKCLTGKVPEPDISPKLDEHNQTLEYSIISTLEKEGVFGEEPQRHWSKNGIECKLQLKDENFRIIAKKIEATNENISIKTSTLPFSGAGTSGLRRTTGSCFGNLGDIWNLWTY